MMFSLKVNQDHPDMFEEPEANEHVYLETKANLGSHNLSGAVFDAAPEKYNSVLYITTEMKGYKLDIDDLKVIMYKLWHQVGKNPEEIMTRIKLYCLHLLAQAIREKARDIRPLTARRKAKVVMDADVVVVVAVETKDKAR
jgi:hypothetical protein